MTENTPAPAALPSLKILAVDDSRTNLQILRVFLEKLGHTVILAESGEAGVAAFSEHHPDLVLMDIMMPGMSGFEATTQIRALPSERWVPIIFLSALDRDENLVTGLEVGGDDYISKPINFVVLEARIRSMQRTLLLQTAVADSRQRLQRISDSVFEAILTIDSQATITSCNLATEHLFGWRADELLGRNVKVLVPSPHHEQHDRYVRDYVAGGPPHIIGSTRELEAVRKDGSRFEAELTVSELRIDGQRAFAGVIRDIGERKRAERLLRESAAKLQRYYDASEAENSLAMALIEQQMKRSGLSHPAVDYWLSPALNFSGDVLAATEAPNGSLFLLIADATGHGLTAAISTLPLLTLFYRLADEGIALQPMLLEINRHLRESLPVGRFVAATLVQVDAQRRQGELWIGGMPDVLMLACNGTVRQRFASHGLPLGIVDGEACDFIPEIFSWESGGQLAMYSDGLREAANQDGTPFGEEKLLAALGNSASVAGRRDAVQDALLEHLGTTPPQDDVSLLLLRGPEGS